MSRVTLHHGDNRESLRRLIDQGVRVHSVVCDPPYGLTSIQKRFGKDGAAPPKFGTDGAFARASAGFMGSKWDGTGIERDPEFWRLVWEILLPGGYVVAFSGSRTGHWQACAMEMAGFIMHPFLGWLTGQGFPKAHNASKAIDRELGTTDARETVAELYTAKRIKPGATVVAEGGYGKQDVDFTATVSRGGSPEAQQWEGWAYGGQALKPALEPIYVGQKPFSEKNGALNLLKHGVGALNIDGCRVATTESTRRPQGRDIRGGKWGGGVDATPDHKMQTGGSDIGRHPANLLHDGSDEVVALFPDSGGQRGALRGHDKRRQSPNGTFGEFGPAHDCEPRNDSGSAARFFNSFPLDADPIRYQAKATKADRAGSKHPTVKPIALMQWLCRLVTPPGGIVLDPFAGSGTTGQAALNEGFDCILMEAEDQFAADIRRRFGLADDDDFDALLPEADDFDGAAVETQRDQGYRLSADFRMILDNLFEGEDL